MRVVSLFGAATVLTGCVLAPQTIRLSDAVDLRGKVIEPRNALVRVVDERGVDKNRIGHRGGRSAEDSPLLSEQPIEQTLTARLQNTLETIGFGTADSESEPLKLQLDIQAFDYKCNEGVIVNECNIEIRFLTTVIDGNRTFKKPYGSREMRSLAASPVAEYNQKWINEELDKVWQYMFTDPDFKQAIGAY